MLLQALHGPGGLQLEQLAVLVDQAAAITRADADMQWQAMERISNRQQARIKTGGLVGSIRYSGDLLPFVPYLRAGEVIHVGKSTTFGFGRYSVQHS